MVKVKLLRVAMAGATGLILASSIGIAGASREYGHGNDWHKDSGNNTSIEQKNNTEVGLNNSTNQVATTGEAKVEADNNHNKGGDNCRGEFEFHRCGDNSQNDGATVGDATTGDATNDNSASASVAVTNSSDPCACLPADSSSRGGDSVKVEVNNDTEVQINNDTTQVATSGDATVEGGSQGTAGSATTGNASNSNSTSFDVTVSN